MSEAMETAYLVDPLVSNWDLVTRYTAAGGQRCTGRILHTDAAGWTSAIHPYKEDFFSLQVGKGLAVLYYSSFCNVSHGFFSESNWVIVVVLIYPSA